MIHQPLTNDMESSRVHEQHGKRGPLEGQVDCNSVPATAAQNGEARSNCPRDASKPHKNGNCLDLRHAVVRLVARISVLEARLLQNTEPGGEQEHVSIEGESEVPLFPGTGLLGMWQAYLGAGCVPRSRVGVQVLQCRHRSHRLQSHERSPSRRGSC